MKFFSHELAIDLGTANTVIFHKGQIALDEPSIVAIDTKTGDPILECFYVPEKERAYVIKFYLTGIYAIVMEWLDKNCSDDTATVIKVIIDCVMGERNING